MTTGGRRRPGRVRRILDRLAELLKQSTRPNALTCLVRAMKTEERQKAKVLNS